MDTIVVGVHMYEIYVIHVNVLGWTPLENQLFGVSVWEVKKILWLEGIFFGLKMPGVHMYKTALTVRVEKSISTKKTHTDYPKRKDRQSKKRQYIRLWHHMLDKVITCENAWENKKHKDGWIRYTWENTRGYNIHHIQIGRTQLVRLWPVPPQRPHLLGTSFFFLGVCH